MKRVVKGGRAFGKASAIQTRKWPVDPIHAYPEPVGTLDHLELVDGSVFVTLNGNRSKLVGPQSIDFLIDQLIEIRKEVFGSKPAYIVRADLTSGSLLTHVDFEPEVYTDQQTAIRRVGELDESREEYCGYHYTFESANMNKPS